MQKNSPEIKDILLKPRFYHRSLSPRTKNLLRISVPLLALTLEEPGSKRSSREIVLPPKESLLTFQKYKNFEGGVCSADHCFGQTGTAAASTCVLLHL